MDNSQYFYRTISFTRANGQVSLVDIKQVNNVTPLDDWLGTVLSLADGQHTIQELFDFMYGQYPVPPDNLEKTLLSVLERLEQSQLIRFSDETVSLPYYLVAPIEELNLEQAQEMAYKDGYVGPTH